MAACLASRFPNTDSARQFCARAGGRDSSSGRRRVTAWTWMRASRPVKVAGFVVNRKSLGDGGGGDHEVGGVAADGAGKMWGHAYTVTPSGIFAAGLDVIATFIPSHGCAMSLDTLIRLPVEGPAVTVALGPRPQARRIRCQPGRRARQLAGR